MKLLYEQQNGFGISATINDLIALLSLGYTIYGRSIEEPYIGRPYSAKELRTVHASAKKAHDFSQRCIAFDPTYLQIGEELAGIISPPLLDYPLSDENPKKEDVFTCYLISLIWGEKPLTQAALKLIEDVRSWKQSN